MSGAKRLNSRIQFSSVEALNLGQTRDCSSAVSHLRDNDKMLLFRIAHLEMGEESNDLNRFTET